MTKNLCLKLRPAFTAVVALALASGTVHASTAQERRILQEAAPHTTAPTGGDKVIAHYATVAGYIEGQPRNAERLAKFKAGLDNCIPIGIALGVPIIPPTEWPDYLTGVRTDAYHTEHYSITYTQTTVYGGYTLGCSLTEQYSHLAVLQSTAGMCTIDLIGKAAWGQCDMAAHHKAKPYPPSPPTLVPLQSVAGLRCEIRSLVGIDSCSAVDGKMKPSSHLILSFWSEYGFHYKATAAALDIKVSERIFVPHLQGGFRVTAKQP